MLHYIDSGGNSKRIILLLHGLGTDADSWHFQFTSLPEKGYRLIAPDIPGFSRSPLNSKRWSIQTSADQVIDLLNALGIISCIIAGMSMGGTVALKMALQCPNRFSGLILINTFASLKPKSLSEWVYFIRRGLKAFVNSPSDQARIVAERVFPNESQALFRELLVNSIESTDTKVYRQAMIELARFNVTQKLSQIAIPTLIISGEDDTTIPLAAQKVLAESIPGAVHQIIPHAGHGVMVDQPEVFNRKISEFMEKIQGS